VLIKPKKKRRAHDGDEDASEEENSEVEDDPAASEGRPRKRNRTVRRFNTCAIAYCCNVFVNKFLFSCKFQDTDDPYVFDENSANLDSQDVDLALPSSSEQPAASGSVLSPPTTITNER
jgi:hypothetical protein